MERPLGPDILNALRYYLSGRRGLIVLAGVAVVGGLSLNWGWLVAIGVAPIIIAALPCVVMCALGLCMRKMTSGTSQTTAATAERPSGVDLSWMRSQNLTAALPQIAAREDRNESPATPASDTAPMISSCCSSATERK
jgi:hypothetical protein